MKTTGRTVERIIESRTDSGRIEFDTTVNSAPNSPNGLVTLSFVFLIFLLMSCSLSYAPLTTRVSGVETVITPGRIVNVILKTGEKIEKMQVLAVSAKKIEGIQYSEIKGKRRNINRSILISDILKIDEENSSNMVPGAGVADTNDSTKLFRVETRDGNEYVGRIIHQDQLKLSILTEKLGQITINKTDILEISPFDASLIVNGDYWFENPQATRYLWSPNGYGLKKGEGYYQNVWVLFNQFSVGITDDFSLGAGIVPGFLFGGSPTPVWIAPKFSIPVKKDKLNLGIGALTGTMLGAETSSGAGFGIIYGTTTVGSKDRNCSVGVGYGYSGGGWSKAPTVTFSSLIRTGARGYFITENYFISSATSYTILLSFGGRRIINKTGIDFGLVVPITKSTTTLVAIPWLGITMPFNKRIQP